MTETIKVSESLELHAVAENHVTPLYQLICKNKTWLQQSLTGRSSFRVKRTREKRCRVM